MSTKLLSTNHYVMEENDAERIVILRRTAFPFASVDDIARSTEQVLSCLRASHRRWGLVTDLRLAPPRNDPPFEEASRKLRVALAAHFARVAVLLQTPVGVLQVNRVKRDDGVALFATLSEDEALRFARGQPKT